MPVNCSSAQKEADYGPDEIVSVWHPFATGNLGVMMPNAPSSQAKKLHILMNLRIHASDSGFHRRWGFFGAWASQFLDTSEIGSDL
jgi:hypothetical protein